MDFKELGHLLQTEREKQGLSITEVHERIKIGPSSIEAIEAGDQDSLPHRVYYKGFVRNYAVFLGLDPAECLKPFEESDLSLEEDVDQTGPAAESEVIPEEFAEEGGRKKRHWLSIIISLCLLVLLGWLLSKLFLSAPSVPPEEQGPILGTDQQALVQPETEEQPPEVLDDESLQSQTGSPETPPDAEPASEAGPESPDAVGTETPDETANETPDETTEEASGLSEPEASGPEEAETGPTAAESRETEAPDEEETAAAPDKHTLKISASEACWLSASMDDRDKDIYLRPGESITLHFEEELAVKLGNAGGVALVYNGEPYTLQADSGEVLTLTFP